MATWKKTPVKTEAVRINEEVVVRESITVNATDTASRPQRRSEQWEVEIPGRNVKEEGNPASKPNEDIPLLVLDVKLLFSPIMEKTPQPPYLFDIKPAWIADPQMKESARYTACFTPGEDVLSVGPPITNGLYITVCWPIVRGFKT